MALVFVGGALGVFGRELLMFVLPDASGLPLAILVANLLGAFLLGLLLEAMTRPGPETELRSGWRLLLGTGLLGGFTTYSALAQAVALLFADHELLLALGYGLVTVLLGLVASWGGILLGGMLAGGRARAHLASERASETDQSERASND